MASPFSSISTAQTSAGSTQATAALMVAHVVMLSSVGASEGIILPNANALDERAVVNGDSDTDLAVYPPVGGKINNHTVNLPLMVAANRATRFIAVDHLNWLAIF